MKISTSTAIGHDARKPRRGPVHRHGGPVVRPRARHERRVGCGQLALDQVPKHHDRPVCVVELEHHRVADALDQFVTGLEHASHTFLEAAHDEDRLRVAVRLGESGEPGEIDEGEGCFHGGIADRRTVRPTHPSLPVGEGGLEPPHPFEYQHLKLARLPFRHSPE